MERGSVKSLITAQLCVCVCVFVCVCVCVYVHVCVCVCVCPVIDMDYSLFINKPNHVGGGCNIRADIKPLD